MTSPGTPGTLLSSPPARWLRQAFLLGGLAFLTYLGIRFVRRDALKYLEWSSDVYLRFWPQRWLLATHVLTAAIALLAAPLQFVTAVRKRWPRFHRALGWIYVGCCLVSWPLVMRLATFSSCAACAPPFLLWGLVWAVVTAAAVVMAVRREFDAHRQFMVRSWVLMNGFVFVRLDTHLQYPLPSGPGIDRASMVLWVSWVIPLLFAEAWLSWGPTLAGKRRDRPRTVTPPSAVDAAEAE